MILLETELFNKKIEKCRDKDLKKAIELLILARKGLRFAGETGYADAILCFLCDMDSRSEEWTEDIKHGIKELSMNDILAVMNCEEWKERGRYYCKCDEGYLAVDNSTGDAFTEQFTDYKEMIRWLGGEDIE